MSDSDRNLNISGEVSSSRVTFFVRALYKSGLVEYGRVLGAQTMDDAKAAWDRNYRETVDLARKHRRLDLMLKDPEGLGREVNRMHLQYNGGRKIHFSATFWDSETAEKARDVIKKYAIGR